ncbi:MAG: TRAP transporter small permease subunit [Acidobacteriota bacterium]
MNRLLRIALRIDRMNAWLGRGIAWLTLAMVLVGAYNAIVRYLGRFVNWNLSSNAYLELQWHLFSAVFLLGAADALRRGAHVRVDLVYRRLSARGRAWIDLIGALVFLLPFTLVGFYLGFPSVRAAWRVREGSPDPGGLPLYPLKTLILVSFALLFLQGVAEVIRRIAVLRGVLDAVDPALAATVREDGSAQVVRGADDGSPRRAS